MAQTECKARQVQWDQLVPQAPTVWMERTELTAPQELLVQKACKA
jgi:hypothetical protein